MNANTQQLTASMLATATPREQKRMLGDRLYPILLQYYKESAARITGMLLELDNAELLHMLNSRDTLLIKVTEKCAFFRFIILTTVVCSRLLFIAANISKFDVNKKIIIHQRSS